MLRKLCAFGGSLFVLSLLYAGCASTALPPTDAKNDAAKEDKKNGDEKDFAEIIKECKPITGMLTIYHNPKDGKAYLELKPEQMDKIMLCSVTRESGDGTFLDAAAMEDNFPFFFRQVNKRIQLIHKNVLVRADRDKPAFRAVEKGVSDSLISSSIVLSKPHSTTGAVLVSLNDLFLFDRYNLAQHLNEATKSDFSFDRDNSFFSTLKSFPANTDIEITMHFRSNKGFYSATIPDKSLFIRYYYSILALPQDNYIPRLADDRVGHFITMYQDYSSMKPETPFVRYINRWNLEKSDPTAALSAPKKPIVFWLEKTIPIEYREPIKKGVLLWNKAFEQAGFKDAVVVNQQPDDADWDPADARYNTIRWLIRPGSGYAVGPSHEDPFTGQLYAADIRISADMARVNYAEFEEVINPLGINNAYCNYANGLAYQAAFASSMLTARAFLDGKEKEAEQFVADYLTDLAVHEVGHTLGLRHNFKASNMLSAEQLHDKALTSEKGLIASVMDYNPANISVDPAKQGEFWSSTVGPYDCWAIEYAYKPLGAKAPDEELTQLKAIAARCAQPELAYGTDEDCHGNSPTGIDPTCTLWDLGNDQLEYVNQRLKLAQELWGKIEFKFSKPGEGYQKMRRVFNQGIKEYAIGTTLAARFIGGIYHRRDHIGDTDGRVPFEPVASAKQQQALDFIVNNIFSLSEKSLPDSEVLNKLAPERMPGADSGPTLDVQIYNTILSIQQSALNYMYEPTVLRRLNNMALKYKEGEPRFGLEELFHGVRDGIWTEATKAENINPFRRNLQRAHMEKIISIYLSDSRSYPSDAIALARQDMLTIKNHINTINLEQLDTLTRAHLDDIKERITTALEWKVSKPF
ncbi:MAG: zinc-dependent metalloprotease [Planctomycetes bacterium]|nr:zinc-dependent metalloprotease [Planctomycetota bacterium]